MKRRETQGTARVAADQPVLQRYSLCCSGACVAAAQPVLLLPQPGAACALATKGFVAAVQPELQVHGGHCLCCCGTARVAGAQPVLQRHCLCCSCAARVAAAQHELQRNSLCCSGTAWVAEVQDMLQQISLCCSSTACLAAVQPKLQQRSLCCCCHSLCFGGTGRI